MNFQKIVSTYNFLEEKPCVLCRENAYKIVYRYPAGYYDHTRYETCSWDGRQLIPLSIVQCASCGLVYARPSFKAAALDMVYPSDIVSDAHFDATLKSPKHQDIVRIVQHYFPERQVLLDIGTRYGALPYLARQAGYQAYGLEYNAASVDLAHSHGIDYIFQGALGDLRSVVQDIGLSSVDIVVMDDVVEHLVNPVDALQSIAKVQSRGDGLIMRQMNWGSLGRHLFGAKWYYIQPAAHMYYFDSKSVQFLLDKTGYEVVEFVLPKFVNNVLETVLMIMQQMVRQLKVFNLNGKGQKKISYLQRRWRSKNDMFTVVACKR